MIPIEGKETDRDLWYFTRWGFKRQVEKWRKDSDHNILSESMYQCTVFNKNNGIVTARMVSGWKDLRYVFSRNIAYY